MKERTFYDLVFVGHVASTEVRPFGMTPHTIVSGAALFATAAAASIGKKIALLTRMADVDSPELEPLRRAGVSVHVVPTRETTRTIVEYRSEDVEDRQGYYLQNAGPFTMDDLACITPTQVHLAGMTSAEFEEDFPKRLVERGFTLALDLQIFIHQPDRRSGRVTLHDFPKKTEIAGIADKLKLDVTEGLITTGSADPERAAMQYERWGAKEVMVTGAEGVLVRHRGKTYYEPFAVGSSEGRTGRGDTAFGSYVARRLDYDVAESLRFATAMTSIKMATPGPFRGSLDEVLRVMRADSSDPSSAGGC